MGIIRNQPVQKIQLVQKIHDSPGRLVLALNGGSRALAELLETPGGSRTLLEATIPYSEDALTAWLGCRPEQVCSARTARAMAFVGFRRALRYDAAESVAAGISCSASLASDRPKRGPHRAHVALQTTARTVCWSLELQKGARSRAEEEQVASRMVLNAVADACGLAERLDLPLLDAEHIDVEQITARNGRTCSSVVRKLWRLARLSSRLPICRMHGRLATCPTS